MERGGEAGGPAATTGVALVVDEFDAGQIARIEQAVAGWGRVVRMRMAASTQEWRDALADATIAVAIGWPPADALDAGGLRFVQLGSSGWDAYAGRGLEERGIALANARGIYSTGVAEHAVAMMLALVRRIPRYVHDKDARVFRRHPPYPDELAGATAAVVGVGEIGRAIARRCKAFEMRVVGVARSDAPDCDEMDEVRVAAGSAAVGAALADADHVFLAMPGSAENAGLIDAGALARLKPSARLYNLSRGSNVDEAALVEALRTGRLAGAGLDVTAIEPLPPESPLWDLGDDVLITGHSAGVSNGHPERFCQLILRNLANYRDGRALENRVL